MLIKAADDKQGDLDTLAALLARPDLDASTRVKVEQEIRTIRAGIAGERDAAYQIDFHYRDEPRRAVIHDLRLEVGGRVAQIDHLLISRALIMWVCESKHFAEGVGVNEHGEWVAFWNGRARGIPSPVEQNRRHIAVLNDVFNKGLVPLPQRLGIPLKPQLQSLILVSSGARISRPKGRAGALVDGLDTVVKADQLVSTIDKQLETMSTASALRAIARLISETSLVSFATQLAALHRPAQVDWAARFGLGPAPIAPPAVQAPISTVAALNGDASCAKCGVVVSAKVAAYCEANPQRFGGLVLCWNCQRQRSR